MASSLRLGNRDASNTRRQTEKVRVAIIGVAGAALRDVVVTRDELLGLERSLLTSAAPPLGGDALAEWLQESAPTLGRRYVSELARNFRGQE